MSSTSSSCIQPSPAGGSSSGPGTTVSPFGSVPDRDAMAPPQLAADAPVVHVVDPREEARGHLRRHETRLAAAHRIPGALGQRSRRSRTTAATAAARRPCRSASSARPSARTAASRRRSGPLRAAPATTAGRASNRSSPSNGPGTVMLPVSSMIVSDGRWCRWPISKSFGSCAGVTLTAPEPKLGSTCSSATTGIFRPVSGSGDRRADEVLVALVVRDARRRRCRRASSRPASSRRSAGRTGSLTSSPSISR